MSQLVLCSSHPRSWISSQATGRSPAKSLRIQSTASDSTAPRCGYTRMELPATHLRLPAALPYPLTVQRIHAQPGAHVQKTQRLFTYSFLPNKPDEQGKRERQVREWDSPVLGQVIAWDVREGDIIREPRSVFPPSESERRTDKGHMDPDIDARDLRRPLVKVQEPCTHDVQLNGLCAICGKDLTACVPSSRPENFDPQPQT